MQQDAAGALDIAMRYLGPTARSTWEVRRHLAAKGFAEGEAAAACSRLVELGILDDGRFARDAAEQAVTRRGQAPARIRESLIARGVPEEAIEAALAEVSPEDDGAGELAQAVELATQRLRVLSGPALSVRRRLGSYLARRGYDFDIINQVCNRLVPGDGGPAEGPGEGYPGD